MIVSTQCERRVQSATSKDPVGIARMPGDLTVCPLLLALCASAYHPLPESEVHPRARIFGIGCFVVRCVIMGKPTCRAYPERPVALDTLPNFFLRAHPLARFGAEKCAPRAPTLATDSPFTPPPLTAPCLAQAAPLASRLLPCVALHATRKRGDTALTHDCVVWNAARACRAASREIHVLQFHTPGL